MNSHERVERALTFRHPDRVPMSDALWEDTVTRWYHEGLPRDAVSTDVFQGSGGIAGYFGFDIDHVSIDASPRLEQQLLSDDGEYVTYRDRFGYTVRKPKGKSRTMHFADHVTADHAAWDRLRERFVLRAGDTARVDTTSYFMHMDAYPTWAEASVKFDRVRERGRYVLADAYGPWEATWRHRGFEALLIDVAADPDFVADMAGTYADLLLATLRRCLDEGIRPDGFFMVEDLGTTRGMLISPRAWRRIFKPLVGRVGEFLREHGLTFWMHCCGNAEPIFSDLIECGLQVIQPLEAKSGLDVRDLRSKYGRRLCYWGNIDVVNMAQGTDAQVAAEIRNKILPFVEEGGGYIYHSDHSVPPEVGLSRYCYVLDLVRRCGT